MKRHEVIHSQSICWEANEPNRYRAGSRFAAAALARSNHWAKITNTNKPLTLQWIDELAESSSVRRTLVEVKRKFFNEPSCLERGSAATRTVVRSISRFYGTDELTHISRINRR